MGDELNKEIEKKRTIDGIREVEREVGPVDEVEMDEIKAAENELAGESGKKKMSKKQKIILGVICGVCAVVLVVLAVVLNLPREEAQNCGENGVATNCIADDTDDDESVQDIIDSVAAMGNTELSGGTYTTTIGGKSVTYKAAHIVDGVDAYISSGTYESSSDDEVVFLVVNGGTLTVAGDVKINKTGSANFQGRGDDYSFYGKNSAVVVAGAGSEVTLIGVEISTSVSGANAVVATNEGSAVVQQATIATTKDNSRGLHATYEGVILADNVSITTLGGSCAALATDRGEGYVTASNMKLSTAGAGSPLIYSTGVIVVSDSTGTATGAQIAVVEGKNSVTITGSEFTALGAGNRVPTGAQYPIDNAAVMIYQSMSGDAGVGTGSFTAKNSKFTVTPDTEIYALTPFFFVTNTTAEISLTDVTAEFCEDCYFMVAEGTDEWGRDGANGGHATITAGNLTATNTQIFVDGISSVEGV